MTISAATFDKLDARHPFVLPYCRRSNSDVAISVGHRVVGFTLGFKDHCIAAENWRQIVQACTTAFTAEIIS